MRYLSYAILGVLALISIVVGALWSSSYLSMDHTYTHRSETLKLPAFDRGVSDGLVRLDTKRGEFRARVAGFAA
ncbi:MAG: hypothetical protein VXY44_07285, partial [Pseudomonadota bacterium]|nr:hypothetical protein [Pseudomonadota bacterium]